MHFRKKKIKILLCISEIICIFAAQTKIYYYDTT